jgi:Retinal pigment epithelial membrane protein
MSISFLAIYVFYLQFFCGKGFLPLRSRMGKKYSIQDKEVTRPILYTLPESQEKIIQKLDGFFGVIGPDKTHFQITNLIDMFMSDGNIQGVFFQQGKLTYVKKFVRTEKVEFEEKYGRLPDHFFFKPMFMLLHKLRLFPNVEGVANTAIVHVHNKTYALYERDAPYLLDIDFNTTQIHTVKKMKMRGTPYFSAHSKYNEAIESLDYDIMTKSINYHQFSENFEWIRRKQIKTKHMPFVHDFLILKDKLIFVDAPFSFNVRNIFTSVLPVLLNKREKTILQIVDKNTGAVESYISEKSFFIFHYADCKEDDRYIFIYASMYDHLDFSEFNISGKYRILRLDKVTKQVSFEKNDVLEALTLEFPIRFEDKIVFSKNNGFVICRELDVLKQFSFEDRFVCGEPVVKYIENKPYLIAFMFHNTIKNQSYLMMIDLTSYEIMEIPFSESLNIGFHSTFIDRQ